MTTALPKPYTVLLVDDDIHNQRIFDTILRHNGFTVRMAASGDEALREARRETVLVGRLHLVRGRALRALSERATAAGDTATATTRRPRRCSRSSSRCSPCPRPSRA